MHPNGRRQGDRVGPISLPIRSAEQPQQQGAEFFTAPAQPTQRRYGILRAYFAEGAAAGDAAGSFGVAPSTAAAMVRDFRAGDTQFFVERHPGPQTAPAEDAAHGEACACAGPVTRCRRCHHAGGQPDTAQPHRGVGDPAPGGVRALDPARSGRAWRSPSTPHYANMGAGVPADISPVGDGFRRPAAPGPRLVALDLPTAVAAALSKARNEALAFARHWKAATGSLPELLGFDSKVTIGARLGAIDAAGIRFLTPRHRKSHADGSPEGVPDREWTTVTLDRREPHARP
jgi:hypothetical protein